MLKVAPDSIQLMRRGNTAAALPDDYKLFQLIQERGNHTNRSELKGVPCWNVKFVYCRRADAKPC